MKKTSMRLLLLVFGLAMALTTMAQVTTSSMSGRVTDGKEPLIGATVMVTHLASGTKYGAVTNTDGYYTIQGMRPGGPYQVDFAYVGYTKTRFDDIALHLGEMYSLNCVLKESSQTLNDVVVVASKIVERAGTNTDVSTRQIESMPTISRSINDFTRLSPYSGNSSSFAGQDGRYNNITIDGANFKNNFGLSTSNLPGGDAQPISLDAIDEISVNVAPYDIRQSEFTGASVNAVTRSGDNTLKGSAYTFIRPKSFTGNHIGDVQIAGANSKNSETYGFRLGGPIIKDKLFYFVNAEIQTTTLPSNAFVPSTNGVGNASTNTARTTVADLQTVSNYLKSTYGYDAGSYQNFGNFHSNNYKLLGRIDWNIDENNKLTIRYNYVHSKNDVLTNASSGPSSLVKGSGRSSVQSVAFSNAFYNMTDIVGSITGELNSKISNIVSNKFLTSYTHIQDVRGTNSTPFPFVDIWSGGDQYMSFGEELFTYNNNVINNTFNATDNLSININNHTLTAGISYDQLYFFNSYLREGTSYYRYASVQDFLSGAQPTGFGYTYGYNGNSAPGQELTFGMGAAYVQDEWKVLPNLSLNYGVRVEEPYYLNSLPDNVTLDNLNFLSQPVVLGGNSVLQPYHMSVGSWPHSKATLAPRIGFNWDAKNDHSLILRGGTGIFTGLLPFVWFTNQPGGSGMIQSPEISLTGSQLPANFKFEPDFQKLQSEYPTLFPNTPGSLPNGSNVAEVAKNFKMPQVWRSNLGADLKLPDQTQITVEGLYSKDINAIVQENVNLPNPQSQFAGPDPRQRWTSSKVVSTIGSAMILKNTNLGYSYSFSTQIKKTFDFGLSAMIAYTYSVAKDATPNPGSTAASAWSSNVAVNSLNNPGLSYSSFSMPHRLVGSLSYRVAYTKNFATTVSIFYQGSPQQRMNFTYSNDMNGDGNASDLIYIPKSQNELTFVDYKNSAGTVVMTAADQAAAFWNYVQGNSYLKRHEGQYAQRYAYVLPWVHDFDVKVLEDIFTNFGGKHKYTLQVSFDLLNAGNLLNSHWGTYKTIGIGSYDNIRPLTYKGVVSSSNPIPEYTLNATSLAGFQQNNHFVDNPTTGSTWGALLGFRLIF
jgi:hypothetical protein